MDRLEVFSQVGSQVTSTNDESSGLFPDRMITVLLAFKTLSVHFRVGRGPGPNCRQLVPKG